MPSSQKSSSIVSSVPITNIVFPEEFSQFKPDRHYLGRADSDIKPVRSIDFGIPQIITAAPTCYKRSPIASVKTPSVASARKTEIAAPKSPATNSRIISDSKIKCTLAKFAKPCEESVIFGAPPSHIGVCPTQVKTKFQLTEDPRKRFCLKNPKKMYFKPIPLDKEIVKIRGFVKNAENVNSESESPSSKSSICEVIDRLNPFGLDFQGTDYKLTYERDEQGIQNTIEYRKVRRYQQRRNLKIETVQNTEAELLAESIAVPKRFELDKSSSTNYKQMVQFTKALHDHRLATERLVRAEQKPKVLVRIKQEEEARKQRYRNLYLKKKKKTAEKQEKDLQAEKLAEAQKAYSLAKKDIDETVEGLGHNLTTKKMSPRRIPDRRKFPHNLTEAVIFRNSLKKSKRDIKNRAIVKQGFYESMGIPKKFPEVDLYISSDDASSQVLTEQSTDDEDDLNVGNDGDKFVLRGYRYRMGDEIRGKFSQKDATGKAGKVKGCITRSEWFDSLVNKNVRVPEPKKNEIQLFPQEYGVHYFEPSSAIREFKKKPLGRHYDRTIRKKLHIKKPKAIKVRKFNLIGYLYGSSKKDSSKSSIVNLNDGSPYVGTTEEYIKYKAQKEILDKKFRIRQRMRYMGIPYHQKIHRTDGDCVNSDSGDSEWIPEKNVVKTGFPETVDLRTRGNMPASETREATLRRDPKNPRDYHLLRIPSEQLNNFTQTQHKPVLKKLIPDKIIPQNVRKVKNTEYASKFEARHHHDHWNPTQHKNLNVRYIRKIVKPKPLNTKTDHSRNKNIPTFDKARPVDSDVEEKNFSLPILDIDGMIKQQQNASGDHSESRVKERTLPETKDKIFHSLEEDQFREFPGRDKFIEFIHEIKMQLDKRCGAAGDEPTNMEGHYLEELKEDLQSIESCLTSLSSSQCTNLSNDSGSFLIAENTKIPLDYLRKSLVPFEEMKRTRLQVVPIDPDKEEKSPFRTVPYAGQLKEQLAMAAPTDSFFTFNTRLQNGMRQRLEVKPIDRKTKLLGPRHGPKSIAQVATDLDELYIEDLKDTPPMRLVKWNSCRTLIKDALRKKFESMLIQGEIVRAKINDRRNEEYYNQMIKSKELFDKLFAKWEKKEYEAAMEVVNKVKPYYEATDVYRKEYQELSKQYTVLNMDIVYIENDWTRRTILQNFFYLMGNMEWRLEHDWIHRNEDGTMEGYRESIAKRKIVNIRPRDKDDAWAIKEFFDEVFLKNPHPIIINFTNVKEFMDGIDNLKSKTFVLLLELHYTLWVLAELEQRYHHFRQWCKIELESKKKFAENKCVNKYFVEERARKLTTQMEYFLGDPIEDTFGDKKLSKLKGICGEVYKDLVPIEDQMELSTLEQVATISNLLNNLIAEMEIIPTPLRLHVEKKQRRLLTYHRYMSRQAVFIERRIASEIIKVQRNLAPPFVKPKRVGKLPRSELKKVRKVRVKRAFSISQEAKFFFKAFHQECDARKTILEANLSMDLLEDFQKSIVPFHFDHFLILNGYQPKYDFETQIERRDGPETDRFQVKKLIPTVLQKFEQWQTDRTLQMIEDITRNPQVYQNVGI